MVVDVVAALLLALVARWVERREVFQFIYEVAVVHIPVRGLRVLVIYLLINVALDIVYV